VIISGRSTPSVLTDAGFLGYAGALGLSVSFLISYFFSSAQFVTLEIVM
jgi:hypothetical protein